MGADFGLCLFFCQSIRAGKVDGLSYPIMNNHNVAYNENEPPIKCSISGFQFMATKLKEGEL